MTAKIMERMPKTNDATAILFPLLTCFHKTIEYYTGMLARTASAMQEQILNEVVFKQRLAELRQRDDVNERIISGAEWVLSSNNQSVTVDAWKKKFGVVTETARQDLLKLVDVGILQRKQAGRKYVYEIMR